MPARLALCVSIALLAAAGRADADARPDQVTIYRCTGADGRLALRDTPCKPGERQQTIEMQRPQDPPPRPKPAPTVVTAPAPASPTVHVVVVERPPPVYECVAPDGDSYTSGSSAGNPRWVPLWTLGYPVYPPYAYPQRRIDVPVRPASSDGHLGNGLVFDGIGRPTPSPPGDRRRAPELPPAVGLAYTPGRWIRDQCHPLPHAEVCQRLRDRHWDLGRRYNSALQGERDGIDAEQRGINARLASECTG